MKKRTVAILLIVVILLALIPLFLLKEAEFGGSDDAGNDVIAEVDAGYEAWATPVLEMFLGVCFSVYRRVLAWAFWPFLWAVL